MADYKPQELDKKWQAQWASSRAFEVAIDPSRPKYYCLEMFAYPSGHAHVGHVRNYIIGDVMARTKRMRGYNVLHPFGWDAFGLPAENAAIKTGTHPETSTLANIAHMKGQLQRLGISYAWEREIATCLPDYYKFNQWIFLKMLERGLAYRKRSTVNWCPVDNTVLANEQVIDGCCWRCGSVVQPRDLEQWFFKITQYADELLAGLDTLTDWPEKVVVMQRNWIGRSEGARVRFALDGVGPAKAGPHEERPADVHEERPADVHEERPAGVHEERPADVGAGFSRTDDVEVFTTRIDTIFGATFIVLAPEHPLVEQFAAASPDPAAFRAKAQAFRSQERDVRMGGKEGFDTGHTAINPFTGKPIPIWIANFVLWGYGTGAVMGVPGHDERDFEFARAYNLPITIVVQREGAPLSVETMTEAHAGEGSLINSGEYNGIEWEEANRRMTADAKARGIGEGTVQYRLKDWGISRQRYWGTPIPVVHCEKDGVVGVPYADLPVKLPEIKTFTGRGDSPLAQVPGWVNVKCPK